MYKDGTKVKKVLVVMALIIGVVSLLYTNYLVTILAQREKKLVNLYARAIAYFANEAALDQDPSLAFEIIESNRSIPVIWADEAGNPISSSNVNVPAGLTDAEALTFLRDRMAEMRTVYEPLVIEPVSGLRQYVYYENSRLTDMLRYYPYVQLTVISLFALMAYIAFSYSRRAEQNRVWVGLAKETAHQLGTPLSSLMAWVEYFKSDDRLRDDPVIEELEKDIQRLEMITARFSNIGSVPTLRPEAVGEAVAGTIAYLRPRISTKVTMEVYQRLPATTRVLLNRPLFEWVIENLAKNAVDAMSGSGALTIVVFMLRDGRVAIDVTDTGKGMNRRQARQVFDPGFTTKKRGWGLGLTLVRRIVENYHGGKIVVRRSEPGRGTTFRITLQPAAATVHPSPPRRADVT